MWLLPRLGPGNGEDQIRAKTTIVCGASANADRYSTPRRVKARRPGRGPCRCWIAGDCEHQVTKHTPRTRMTHTTTIRTASWKYEGWIAAKDFFTAGKLGCCLIASVFPTRFWPTAARLIARAHLRFRSGSIQLLQGSTAFPQQDARSVAQAALAADNLSNIQAIREILPGGWRSEISLEGREILDQALQRSRGVILWSSPFAGSDLVLKKALVSAGYSPTQLSSPTHPFSSTRIGALALNPVRVRAVNRYTAFRVLVVHGNARPALDVIRQMLSENATVLIAALGSGTRSITFPFFGGIIDLASGAPLLAYQTGAALVPAFTLPDRQGGYRVVLGPDLQPSGKLPRQQAIQEMTSRYVDLLEPIVRAHPTQWGGWFFPGTWRSTA